MDDGAWKEHEDIQESYWWHRHKKEFLLHLAEEEPYRRVLEIGSGGGSLAAHLKRPCRKVTTDLSIRHVRPGGVVGRLPHFCFKPASFDLVILSEVLEHLDQPLEALKEIHRLMACKGRCLITVPAWPVLWSDHDIFYGHKKRYTPAILVEEIGQAGLEIQKTGWLFFMPLWAAFARHALKRLSHSRPTNASRPQSNFIRFPDGLNEACAAYLKYFEAPLAFRMRLPIGLTLTAVAVKNHD